MRELLGMRLTLVMVVAVVMTVIAVPTAAQDEPAEGVRIPDERGDLLDRNTYEPFDGEAPAYLDILSVALTIDGEDLVVRFEIDGPMPTDPVVYALAVDRDGDMSSDSDIWLSLTRRGPEGVLWDNDTGEPVLLDAPVITDSAISGRVPLDAFGSFEGATVSAQVSAEWLADPDDIFSTVSAADLAPGPNEAWVSLDDLTGSLSTDSSEGTTSADETPAQDDGGAQTYTSTNGLASMMVPDGAAPDSADVGIVYREPDEMPLDLSSWPSSPPHLEVQPLDAEFVEPVTVTRTIPLADSGIDPVASGVPLGVLAIRDADLEWSWLTDPEYHYDIDAGTITMSGKTEHGGLVFAFASAQLSVAVAPESGMPLHGDISETPVGERAIVLTDVSLQPDATATFQPWTGTTADPAVSEPAQTFATGLFGTVLVEHYFECVGAGESRFEAPFFVHDFGAANSFTTAMGLQGATTWVLISGTLRCVE